MPSAVLFSGGLDSAVLLAHECRTSGIVWPVHVRSSFAWEDAEARCIRALLSEPPFRGRTQPAKELTVDMRDVYPSSHWALTGHPPAYDTPDEDVYLEGRNVSLLAKTAVFCHRVGATRIVLGPLAGNPFPDARPAFFDAMARALSLGVDSSIEVAAPFRDLHKADVIRLGRSLDVPLERTLSCMNPVADSHCGLCSKCRERQEAFRAAGVPDATAYAASPRLPT
jgi:7-cyano-7-deazaguanine synthase